MADGDVVLDESGEFDAHTETRFELFAVESVSAAGGYADRFEYYHPEEGHILRYDNAHHISGVGHHHRHYDGTVTGLSFHGLEAHADRFRNEVTQIDVQR